MLNTKFLFVAAMLVVTSGCGRNFDGRYEGVETSTVNMNTYPSTAVMNLKQDGDIVTGDYTVQRAMGQMAGQQAGSMTYRLTARAQSSDSLEGVQLYVTQNANSQYGQWGGWGNMSSCASLGGNLSAPNGGQQISGQITQAGMAGQQNTMCSFNLNLTKVSED